MPSAALDPTAVAAGALRTGRPRDEAREQAILDAALRLVVEVGYDRMSMDAIAAAAQASKATIYRRWPGKVELVVAALRSRVPKPLSVEPLGNLHDELLAFVEQARSHTEGVDGGLMRGIATAAGTDPELAAALDAEFGQRKEAALDEVVERAVARGELLPWTSSAVLHEVVPAVFVFRHLCGSGLSDEFVHHVVDDIALPLLSHQPDPSIPPEHQRSAL